MFSANLTAEQYISLVPPSQNKILEWLLSPIMINHVISLNILIEFPSYLHHLLIELLWFIAGLYFTAVVFEGTQNFRMCQRGEASEFCSKAR